MKQTYLKYLLLCTLVILSNVTLAYDSLVVDSLENLLRSVKEDTVKINALSTLAWELKDNNPDTAILLSIQALEIIHETERSGTNDQLVFFKKAAATSHFTLGVLNRLMANYTLALEHYNKANKIYGELNDKKQISKVLGSIGLVYLDQGDYPHALEYLFKTLAAYEELEYERGIAIYLGNIGVVYSTQGDYPHALEYYFKALKMRQELGADKLIASTLGGIGSVYSGQGDYPKALEYFFKALKISEELGNKRRIAVNLGNIGNVWKQLGDSAVAASSIGRNLAMADMYPKALEYYSKALKLSEELGNKNHIAVWLNRIGALYTEQKNYSEAERYLMQALEISIDIEALDLMENHYKRLSTLYEQNGEYENSYEYYLLFHQIYDSIYNEQKGKQIAEIQTRYESEKKERKIKLLKTKEQLHNVELSKQRTVKNAIIGGLALLLLLTLLIYNRYLIKKTANAKLKSRNKTIGAQKTKIVASIDYASKIQKSILVNESEILENFPESFIYQQPKDIVSGDFFWFYRCNGKSVIAVVDCTGHGVPGAFMSIIGNTLMNEIVVEKKELDPGKILTKLHLGISRSLHQNEDSDQQDGMDMSLCVIDQGRNLIQFSGAMNPLYIIDGTDDSELKEIPADPYSVGGELFGGSKDEKRKFTTRDFKIRKGMALYLFTDGYMDQFGGAEDRKFSKSRFKEMLFQSHKSGMQQQRKVIDQAMKEWKGDKMQIDDMLVMGIRV